MCVCVCVCVCVWRFVERLKELRITNEKPPLPELYPANSLDALLLKIKTKVIALLGRIFGVWARVPPNRSHFISRLR